MIRNIITLTINDLAIALKNKTFYLILFIPLFVYVSLTLIDSSSHETPIARIGFIENASYAQGIIQSVQASENIIEITWIKNEDEGRRLLKEKRVDGVLLGKTNEQDRHALLVLKREAVQTLTIVEVLSALQKAVEGGNPDWISDIDALYTGGLQEQTLPTWILMIVLLIGFIILPAQVAEEKEKKLLLALLQTPINEAQWLTAKILTGMILVVFAVLFLHLLGLFSVDNLWGYGVIIVVGGFCFSAYGISLGFLCRNQASARTLGVVFYLPHLLPSALSDYSKQLTSIAPLLPSYQFYEPLKSLLLEGGRISNMAFECGYLLLVGLLACCLSWVLMKKRWLM